MGIITRVKNTRADISETTFSHLIVPKSLYSGYEIDKITKIGKRIHTNLYYLDNFLFVLDDEGILMVLLGIEYFKLFPEVLIDYCGLLGE